MIYTFCLILGAALGCAVNAFDRWLKRQNEKLLGTREIPAQDRTDEFLRRNLRLCARALRYNRTAVYYTPGDPWLGSELGQEVLNAWMIPDIDIVEAKMDECGLVWDEVCDKVMLARYAKFADPQPRKSL